MKRLIINFLGITLVFWFFMVPGIASAIPFENVSWKSAGDNLITRYNGPPLAPPYGVPPYDITNLEWLNVGLTLDQSFDSVLDKTKPGSQFDGFRYATVYEIIGIFHALGYDNIMIQSGESLQNILEFSGLLGIPIQGPPGCCFAGALYDNLQINGYATGMLVYGDYGTSSINHAVFERSSAFPLLGSFLVKGGEHCVVTIDSLTATPAVLWPPNHKMMLVTVTPYAKSICGQKPRDQGPICKIVSVKSNEPISSADWTRTDNLSVNLRAERSGGGSDRIYTLTVQCTDQLNNSATKDVTVTVPHDQGKKK